MNENAFVKHVLVQIETPDGPLTVIRPVAERLLKEGAVSGSLGGTLHATDAATVKVAIMASRTCDFCGGIGATHVFDVPDFVMDEQLGVRSVGGWMACDTCHDLILANKRQALLTRALDTLAFPKFSRHAIDELFQKFWRGMDDKADAAGVAAALGDFVEDRLPAIKLTSTPRGMRVESVARMTGLTHAQVEAITQGTVDSDAVKKLIEWHKRYGRHVDPRKLADLLSGDPKKPLPSIVPHWQRALDMQFKALTYMQKAVGADTVYFPEATDLNDPAAVKRITARAEAQARVQKFGFDIDAKALRAAQAYSFNAETIAAISEAAHGIPHDAPLSSIETPNIGAGWFWFSEPLDIKSSGLISDKTHALLWMWVDSPTDIVEVTFDDTLLAAASSAQKARIAEFAKRTTGAPRLSHRDAEALTDELVGLGITREALDKRTRKITEPAIIFSAYVGGDHDQVFPSTRWFWPLSMSYHDMLAFNIEKYRESYGPGGPDEHDPNRVGEQATLKSIAELSLFFIMACLWFKQTVPILTREPGHVERHAKKRYVKEHKLAEPPTVRVVALRRSARTPSSGEHREGGTSREYHCRWIVAGHPRLQACGPKRADRKLIWIDPYPKGPEDKPLRTRKTVFAVVR